MRSPPDSKIITTFEDSIAGRKGRYFFAFLGRGIHEAGVDLLPTSRMSYALAPFALSFACLKNAIKQRLLCKLKTQSFTGGHHWATVLGVSTLYTLTVLAFAWAVSCFGFLQTRSHWVRVVVAITLFFRTNWAWFIMLGGLWGRSKNHFIHISIAKGAVRV